jgi:hypothetical protein
MQDSGQEQHPASGHSDSTRPARVAGATDYQIQRSVDNFCGHPRCNAGDRHAGLESKGRAMSLPRLGEAADIEAAHDKERLLAPGVVT